MEITNRPIDIQSKSLVTSILPRNRKHRQTKRQPSPLTQIRRHPVKPKINNITKPKRNSKNPYIAITIKTKINKEKRIRSYIGKHGRMGKSKSFRMFKNLINIPKYYITNRIKKNVRFKLKKMCGIDVLAYF